MKPESIVAALRLSTKTESKVRAFADVTISLGDGGTVTMFGFSVLHDGRPPRVMSPARKGQNKWFDVVELTGRILQTVEEAVLAEYRRQAKISD